MVNNKRLYVGGIDEHVRATHLGELFGQFGKIKDIWVGNKPPYFAFVEFADINDAAEAKLAMEGKILMQCKLKVEFTRHDSGAPKWGGGGGYGRNNREPYRGTDGRPPPYVSPRRPCYRDEAPLPVQRYNRRFEPDDSLIEEYQEYIQRYYESFKEFQKRRLRDRDPYSEFFDFFANKEVTFRKRGMPPVRYAPSCDDRPRSGSWEERRYNGRR